MLQETFSTLKVRVLLTASHASMVLNADHLQVGNNRLGGDARKDRYSGECQNQATIPDQ
jgi:hypothetical protein